MLETTGCFSIFKHFKIILYGLRHTESSAFLFLLFSTLWPTKWASVGAGVAGYVQGVGYTSGWRPSLLLTTATYVHAQLRWWKHILLISSHVCVISLLPLSTAATAERPPRANTSARCQCHAWTQSGISRVALTGPVVWKSFIYCKYVSSLDAHSSDNHLDTEELSIIHSSGLYICYISSRCVTFADVNSASLLTSYILLHNGGKKH